MQKAEAIKKWEAVLDEQYKPAWWDPSEVSNWARLMNTPANQSLGVFSTLPSYERYLNSFDEPEYFTCYHCGTEQLVVSSFTSQGFDPTHIRNLECGHIFL